MAVNPITTTATTTTMDEAIAVTQTALDEAAKYEAAANELNDKYGGKVDFHDPGRNCWDRSKWGTDGSTGQAPAEPVDDVVAHHHGGDVQDRGGWTPPPGYVVEGVDPDLNPAPVYTDSASWLDPVEPGFPGGDSCMPLVPHHRHEHDGGVQLNGPGGLLDNDVDSDGDMLQIVGFEAGEGGRTEKGEVWLEADGSAHYRPDPGATGKDTFKYVVADGHGGTSTATATIDLGDGLANHKPEAKNDDMKVGPAGVLVRQPEAAKTETPKTETPKAESKPDTAKSEATEKTQKPKEVEAKTVPAATDKAVENAKGIAKGIADLVADATAALQDGVITEDERDKLHDAADAVAKMAEPVTAAKTTTGDAVDAAKDARDDLASTSSKAMADGKFTADEIKASMAKLDAMIGAIDQVGAESADGDAAFFKRLSDVLGKFVGIEDKAADGKTDGKTDAKTDGTDAKDQGLGLTTVSDGNYLFGLGRVVSQFETNSKYILR